MITNKYTIEIHKALARQLMDSSVSPDEVYRSSLELAYVLMTTVGKIEAQLPQDLIDKTHKEIQERTEAKFAQAERTMQSLSTIMGK